MSDPRDIDAVLEARLAELIADLAPKFRKLGHPRGWSTFKRLAPDAQQAAIDTYEAWVVREARAHPSENSSVPPLM